MMMCAKTTSATRGSTSSGIYLGKGNILNNSMKKLNTQSFALSCSTLNQPPRSPEVLSKIPCDSENRTKYVHWAAEKDLCSRSYQTLQFLRLSCILGYHQVDKPLRTGRVSQGLRKQGQLRKQCMPQEGPTSALRILRI